MENEFNIAFAGNPNVGKSTIFNGLTGLHQHTGNWAGKTVTNARGYCKRGDKKYMLTDLPGCYSLMAHSKEEEVARDYILFEKPDAVCVICDATCLERNLQLVIETIEITDNVIVCVNLLDESRRNGIEIDLPKLSLLLGVPVIGTEARSGKGIKKLLDAVHEKYIPTAYPDYCDELKEAISELIPYTEKYHCSVSPSWLALRLIEYNESLIKSIDEHLKTDFYSNEEIRSVINTIRSRLPSSPEELIVSAISDKSASIAKEVTKRSGPPKTSAADRILTSKKFGYPVMILMLVLIFWITLKGANYPSAFLSKWLFVLQDKMLYFCEAFGLTSFFTNMMILGIYRVLAWVVSVMLPPMLIFFPLFTLLEDAGYLPRVAFNLDNCFKKCCACGKQALTTCMGFGCNAVGVTGARIIDSPRERLIAIITNAFIPCNGRFPTLTTIISLFFLGTSAGILREVSSALLLTGVILFGILMSFAASYLLSKTLLKGTPSSFAIELPPYRFPQFGKVIVRSLFDRTLFVLGRAVSIAAPAGLVIFLLANITTESGTLLQIISVFLDPVGKFFGMDGVIILAFILSLPANEILIPIIIMSYMAKGSILELSTAGLHTLLINNGWTSCTALCVMIFCLMHWPCSTTLITIKKETGSMKWTIVSVILPTLFGLSVCLIIKLIFIV